MSLGMAWLRKGHMCHLCTTTYLVQHIPFCPPKTASTGQDTGIVVTDAYRSLDRMSGEHQETANMVRTEWPYYRLRDGDFAENGDIFIAPLRSLKFQL
jgi:hypothetical protein